MARFLQAVAFGLLLAQATLVSSAVGEESRVLVTRLLRRVPHAEAELLAAHDASKYACFQIPSGTTLAPGDFSQRVWYDVRLDEPGGPIVRDQLFYVARRPLLTFGTQMSVEDQAELPLLTSGAILDRVNNDYMSVQVRLQRDAPGAPAYLHYRPEAAVDTYGGGELATSFATLQENAVREVRGLGLFVKTGQPLAAEALRTLVVSMRGQLVSPDSSGEEIELTPSLEMLFVRARPSEDRTGKGSGVEELSLHAFGTSDGRRRLHYFKPYAAPERLDACSIQSTVRITEYALAGQYPSARAARHVEFSQRASFPLSKLDEYAKAQAMRGDALDNLTEVLDAIIDGKIAE